MNVALRISDSDVQEASAPPRFQARPSLPRLLHSFFFCVPLLTVVLLAEAFVFGPGFGVSADEFALLAQIDALDDGSWARPHPFPEVDPEGAAFPDHHAAVTPDGFVHYAKHPLAPLLLQAARQVAGPFGLRGFLLVGQVLAAAAIARLLRRVAPPAAMPAFWLVGLGSPLALHAHVLWMHSWALALAAVATESVVVMEERLEGRRWLLPLFAVALSVAGLILLRTEGSLFAGAIAGALLVSATIRRSFSLAGLGVVLGAWAVAVWLAEWWWVDHIVGAAEYSSSEQPGFAAGRLNAVVLTYLLGGTTAWTALLMLGSLVLFVAVGWLARQGRPSRDLMVVGAVAVVLHVAALYAPWSGLVPGILPALPVLFVPLLLRRGGGERDVPVLRYLVVLFLVFVALTAHAGGAGIDWGGRYAALAVPALVCLAGARLTAVGSAVHGRRAVLTTMLVVVTAAAAPVVPLRVSRDTAKVARIEAAIETRLEEAVAAGPTGRPVFVTQDVRLGRVLATHPDQVTALRAETDEQLDSLLARLRSAAVTEVVLVGFDDLEVSDLAAGAGWEAADVEKLTDGLSARTLVVP